VAAKTYSASELSHHLGVDRGTVSRWVKDGCPAAREEGKSRGTAWAFEIPPVLAWLLERAKTEGRDGVKPSSLAQIERRQAQISLELAELRLAELRGEVLRVDDVLEIVGADYDSLRRALGSIPPRIGAELWAQVTNGATEPQVIGELERVIDDVMRGLSGGGTSDSDGPGPARAARVAVGNASKAARRPDAKQKRKAATTAKAEPKPVGRRKPVSKRRGKR